MEQASSPQKARRVVSPGVSKREIILGTLAALLIIGLVGYGIVNMGNTSAGTGVKGKVVEKTFVPRPEEQITVGPGTVEKTDKAGLYYLSVRANGTTTIYKVLLGKDDYDRVQVGDNYEIPKASLVP